MWHFGRLALSNTPSTIALGFQTNVVVAALPKSRRFCRNGPNKQKRQKKRQKSGLPQWATTVEPPSERTQRGKIPMPFIGLGFPHALPPAGVRGIAGGREKREDK